MFTSKSLLAAHRPHKLQVLKNLTLFFLGASATLLMAHGLDINTNISTATTSVLQKLLVMGSNTTTTGLVLDGETKTISAGRICNLTGDYCVSTSEISTGGDITGIVDSKLTTFSGWLATQYSLSGHTHAAAGGSSTDYYTTGVVDSKIDALSGNLVNNYYTQSVIDSKLFRTKIPGGVSINTGVSVGGDLSVSNNGVGNDAKINFSVSNGNSTNSINLGLENTTFFLNYLVSAQNVSVNKRMMTIDGTTIALSGDIDTLINNCSGSQALTTNANGKIVCGNLFDNNIYLKYGDKSFGISDSIAGVGGGDLTVKAGSASSSTNNQGGILNLVGGLGGGGGAVSILGGTGGQGGGGSVTIDGGHGNMAGGSIVLNGGTGVHIGNVILSNIRGNVGIGTNSPEAKLHVNGDTILSGDVNVKGGYFIKNTQGITKTITIKDTLTSSCELVIVGGIITATTCP